MINYKSVIEKIVLDIRFEGEKKYYKDVVLDYKPSKDWSLTMECIHWEDNDSWNAIDIDNHHYDIQFFGEDDCLAEVECDEFDEYGNYITTKYDPRRVMSIPIHFQLGEVEKNEDGSWEHNGVWLTSDDVSVRNVRVYTKDGMKRIKVN